MLVRSLLSSLLYFCANTHPHYESLRVTVKQAKNLRDMDYLQGTSDPSAFVHFTGSALQQTSTIDDNLAPNWDETFQFIVRHPETDTLEVTLCDADTVLYDCLGTTSIRFSEIKKKLAQRTTWSDWRTLKSACVTSLRIMVNVCRRGKVQLEYSIIPIDNEENNGLLALR